ncbi:hypothetical protein NECAME_16273 [Necator americanus]|uniref:Uncharacterized protein n=1 Tax=Necator americanus TaxID=51031 RepID=W2TWU5_NECAM|nr:hypothetical protein NECAME_16273 [Necator americanus]ETN86555.1 hypothetical protein NECAME_16273 [Necator americanus]
MASRGRGAAGKRGILPNLSLAGKREGKGAAPSQPKKKRSDRNDYRGGRGRGRGGHAGKERLGLIESSGIFSEGLSGADPSRRKVKVEGGEAYVGTVPRIKEEVTSAGEKAGNYQTGYDEIWESDEEGDMRELSELLRDGFISDYKHGTILPHVLPLELQPQFVDLMHKSVQQEIIDEEEEVKAEIELDIKDHILLDDDVDEEMDDGESPTGKRSRKAARIFKNLDKETRENDLFMIQLPSILKILSQECPSDDKIVFPSDQPNGDTKPILQGNGTSTSTEKPTVEQLKLPVGRRVGKLVVTKGGRVYLRAGGHSMDVAHTASENQHQDVVMVETSLRDGPTMYNGAGRFANSMTNRGTNAIYYMGQVRHHLTASLDWKQLRPIGMEKSKSAPSEVLLSPSRRAKPMEVERMKKELNELQQHRTADMVAALKRWGAS